jgi:hypothetical protein
VFTFELTLWYGLLYRHFDYLTTLI